MPLPADLPPKSNLFMSLNRTNRAAGDKQPADRCSENKIKMIEVRLDLVLSAYQDHLPETSSALCDYVS
jgi:hypothetical protein